MYDVLDRLHRYLNHCLLVPVYILVHLHRPYFFCSFKRKSLEAEGHRDRAATRDLCSSKATEPRRNYEEGKRCRKPYGTTQYSERTPE